MLQSGKFDINSHVDHSVCKVSAGWINIKLIKISSAKCCMYVNKKWTRWLRGLPSAKLSWMTMSSSVIRIKLSYKIIRAIVRTTYSLIEATSSSCISNEMRRAMHRFRQHSRSSRSRRHYVFSGQRHFTSTIFADQILIVGWRLSKEAWPPGWFTFSHAMHERTGFLPLISLLLFSRFFLLSLRILCAAKECDAPRHSRVPSHLQPAQRCPRNARMLIASSYQNRR